MPAHARLLLELMPPYPLQSSWPIYTATPPVLTWGRKTKQRIDERHTSTVGVYGEIHPRLNLLVNSTMLTIAAAWASPCTNINALGSRPIREERCNKPMAEVKMLDYEDIEDVTASG